MSKELEALKDLTLKEPKMLKAEVMFINLDYFKGDKVKDIEVCYQNKKYKINIVKFLEMFAEVLK